jgi:hypothetical protein
MLTAAALQPILVPHELLMPLLIIVPLAVLALVSIVSPELLLRGVY